MSYEDIMKDFKNLISICVFCVHKEKDIGWKTTASKLQDPKREFKKLQKKSGHLYNLEELKWQGITSVFILQNWATDFGVFVNIF